MMYLYTPEQHAQIVAMAQSNAEYAEAEYLERRDYWGDNLDYRWANLKRASEQAKATHAMLQTMQPVEPCAYRFTENRGNGNTEFEYYGLDEVGLAYRDNCLEIVDLYTHTKD